MMTKKEFPTPDCWYPHFISYGETDAMGVVYHAEYLHLFERARSKFIRESGMSYREAEERGIMLPVREASCRYRVPIVYDQEILVHAGIEQWGRASVDFTYEIWNRDKTILHATGVTGHACTDKSGKPVRIPDWLKEMFI